MNMQQEAELGRKMLAFVRSEERVKRPNIYWGKVKSPDAKRMQEIRERRAKVRIYAAKGKHGPSHVARLLGVSVDTIRGDVRAMRLKWGKAAQ